MSFITDIVKSKLGTLASIADLAGLTGAEGQQVSVASYHGLADLSGGGTFVWGTGRHNGGTFIDPNRAFPTDWNDQAQLETWFADSGIDVVGFRRVYDGAVQVKWFGAKGDYTTNDTKSLQNTIDCKDLSGVHRANVLVNGGRYRTTETIYLRYNGASIIGEAYSPDTSTQFNIGGTSITADHQGAAVLSLKGASGCTVKHVNLEAEQFNAPKVGLALGRDSTSSNGNHLIEKVTIRGNYSVSCIYSIASEEVVYKQVSAWLYAENGGLFTYYTAESDIYEVDSFVTSTNISAYFYGCSFVNSSFSDDASVVRIDAAGQTGSFCLFGNYLVPNAGSYIHINNVGNAPELLGPFVFQGVNGERLGESGDPIYGLRVTSIASTILRGLTYTGSRINFLAGSDKKSFAIDSTVSLFNPLVVVNPEEAFAYAVVDVPYGKINGGVFSVGREGFWKSITLAGSWINRFGSPYQQAQYKVSSGGEVCLRGEINGGTGTITTLPVECRPKATNRLFVSGDNASFMITVTTDGTVSASGTGASIDLSGVKFYRN